MVGEFPTLYTHTLVYVTCDYVAIYMCVFMHVYVCVHIYI